MISLSNSKERKKINSENADYFYKKVKDEVLQRLETNKNVLNIQTTLGGDLLTDYLKLHIKDFLIGDIDQVVKTHHKQLIVPIKQYKKIKNIPNSFRDAFDNVFFYENYNLWEAYKIIQKIEVECCPYCNRTYITTLGDDKNKFHRADFDHFMPKWKYPYLRFNFYNLIPSCVVCNQKAKHEKDTNINTHIYPYKDGFSDDAKFSYLPSSYDSLINGYGSKITLKAIDPCSEKGRKIKANIELFRLEQQYSMHYRDLHNILKLKKMHPKGYIDEIRSAFPNLFKSDDEIYEYIFGKSPSEEDFLHQPLSKFTKDLHDEIIIS